jgi:hypothetical protein
MFICKNFNACKNYKSIFLIICLKQKIIRKNSIRYIFIKNNNLQFLHFLPLFLDYLKIADKYPTTRLLSPLA